MTIKLEYLPEAGNTSVDIALVLGVGGQGLQVQMYSEELNHLIDNSNNTYFVTATWVSYGNSGSDQKLKNVRIKYEITNP